MNPAKQFLFFISTLALFLEGCGPGLCLEKSSCSTAANLTISASALSFGIRVLSAQRSSALSITNSGELEATQISITGLQSPFAFVGGSIPGTNGTCGTSLASGSSCTLDLVFTAPSSAGSYEATIQISYFSGGSQRTPTSVVLSGMSARPSYALYALVQGPTAGVQAFTINQTTGALSDDSSLVATGGSTTPWGGVVSPDGSLLFVIDNAFTTPYSFDIDPTLYTLSNQIAGPNNGGGQPRFPVIGNGGKTMYIGSGSSDLPIYSIEGTMTQVDDVSTPATGNVVTLHPTLNYLYANQTTRSPAIAVFSIDSATGDITEQPSMEVALQSVSPTCVQMHPTGKFLYSNGDSAVYSVNAQGGLTAQRGRLPDSDSLFSIDPSGQWLYAIDTTGAHPALHGYSIDTTTGALTEISGSPYTLNNSGSYGSPFQIALDNASRFLYVSDQALDVVFQFSIDDSGKLTSLGSPIASGGGGGNTYGLAIY